MDYSLHLQDPSATSASYLFEEIVAAASKSTRGRAIFAFASKHGVDALLEDPEMIGLLRRGSFELVVGVDAVTTRAALERLAVASRSFKSFRPLVFWNEGARLFHPKLCYFSGARRATLIVGSGNLTSGGLQSNFEAFSKLTVTRRHGEEILQPWDAWLRVHAGRLREIDAEVLSRADRNCERTLPDVEPEGGKEEQSARLETGGSAVLIAEIPRSGARWNQVNFDINTVRTFFKVVPGSTQRVFLERRLPGRANGGQEVRPCVDSGRSHNYRIEIAAGKGIAYPTMGRPIVVFVETAPRMFRYQLVFPDKAGHGELMSALGQEGTPQHRVRRMIVSASELASSWPGNSLLD